MRADIIEGMTASHRLRPDPITDLVHRTSLQMTGINVNDLIEQFWNMETKRRLFALFVCCSGDVD
jgi:hypothetical protein